jgi:hypothetical protein
MREKPSARKPENCPGYKIVLDRKGSNFNAFDTFKYWVRFIKHQKTTVLTAGYHAGGDIEQ